MSIYSVTEAAHITGYSGARIRHYAISGTIDATKRVWGWEIPDTGISKLFALKAINDAIRKAGNGNGLAHV